MLVLVLTLGAASLPFFNALPGGQPEGLAILPAVTLTNQSTPTVDEIRGGDDLLDNASGVAVGNDGTLYVIDVPRDQVRVFTADGTPKAAWGKSGDGPGEFGFSFDFAWGDLAIAPDGNLYVLDPNLVRVQKFTPDGAFLLGFGERGSADGQMLYPTGIGVGPDGNVYIADYQNHRVQVFAGDGTFLAAWDGMENGGAPLAGPYDVAVGPDGVAWVTDDILQKIIGFAPDGTIVASFGTIGALPGEVRGPAGIAVDAKGNIYVADRGNDRLQKFAPDGTLLGLAGRRGEGPGELTQPVFVALGPGGAVYVTEDGAGRVQRFAGLAPPRPTLGP
jgi:sugar lactone lactonase YvrE